ncbi:MAG: acetyl/propionyl/methylcrotonyl-CoA carboxylase subunit alpha [Planctomycetes bacterium]|nr:acetyl/propionyl/methylcrotonyl-CoA carboxylase subunit alpha [Planctomycetota bacterium]
MAPFPIHKILIANRGEIACRIIQTAHRMGIRTVAVHSEADRDARHVGAAGESVCVGPPPAAESYLRIDRIIEACRSKGADAVHPGYGFLSENPAFAARLADEGIAFIGPGADAIRSMGDKIASKRLAQQAGVPTVPGFDGELRDAAHAVSVAREIGYPVMLKATAGGGGKGMRVVRDDDECRSAFERASSEARSAFGDGRVFLEKRIDQPRHVEIQILADRYGTVVHLGERECSIQRRHQKVIEEAPSPCVDGELRLAMGRCAVALAREVGYESAGTVEFLVDADRRFHFLEMNTRLQVEHPVTEFVTGLDLVEWMIRIAAGERLAWSQDDVRMRGWAIEARVYAEDPFRSFLPSVGRVVRYLLPPDSPDSRVDSGVEEGGEIPIHYDPMIAKVIAHGATRDEARVRLREMLSRFCIRGIAHNIGFLAALIDHPRFREGRLSTDLIAETFPDGLRAEDTMRGDLGPLIAVAASIHRRYADRAARIGGQLAGYERRVHDDWVVRLGGTSHGVEVSADDGGHDVRWGERHFRVSSDWRFGQPRFEAVVNGESICVHVERRDLTYRLWHLGIPIDTMVLTARAAALLDAMPKRPLEDRSGRLVSPMPGLLIALRVGPGDAVKRGQALAVIEAMKMENVLIAERDVIIAACLASEGETLQVDQPILEFAPSSGAS